MCFVIKHSIQIVTAVNSEEYDQSNAEEDPNASLNETKPTDDETLISWLSENIKKSINNQLETNLPSQASYSQENCQL